MGRYVLLAETYPLRFRGESLACSRYRNQRFVSFICIHPTLQHPMRLAFEHMDHSNPKDHLRKKRPCREVQTCVFLSSHIDRSSHKRLEASFGVAQALEYLHNRDVAHMNVKTVRPFLHLLGRVSHSPRRTILLTLVGIPALEVLGWPFFRPTHPWWTLSSSSKLPLPNWLTMNASG